MKRLLLASALCAAFASPAFAVPPRVVSTSAGSVTVEFTIPSPSVMPIEASGSERLSRVFVEGFFSLAIEGSPILPVRRFFFAVGAPENVRIDVLEEESYFMSGVLPTVALAKGAPGDERAALAKVPPLSEQRFVRLNGIEKIRGTYCAFVDVYPVLFDPAAKGLSCARRLVVRLSFPPGETLGAGGRGAFFADDLLVNAEQAASWSRHPAATAGAARTPFEFALSSNWVKIGVKGKGIYIVTYNDLLTAGANPALIDPATLRLFSGGPYPEPDSLSGGGSWRDAYHFAEHAILYRGQGGGSLQPTDTVFFYGLPAAGWANDADPSASPRQYAKHPYDSTNVYWLTWGGDFAGSPRRIDERDVAPLYSPSDTLITWYEERIRAEKDLYYDPVYVDDRWYWNLLKLNGSTSYFQDEFFTTDVADASGVMKTKAYGPFNRLLFMDPNTATYLVNGVVIGTATWIVMSDYRPSSMKTLEAAVSNIAEGRNVFGVSKSVGDEMYVFWYEIFYHRFLRASQGALHFGAPERERRARYELGGFPAGEKLLFDVTVDESPVLCTGWQSTPAGLVFEDSLQGRPRRYAAVSRTAFKKGALSFESVPSLRDESACPDMVILYHEAFRDAALMLKAHRERVFPGVRNPVVRAVDIEDVYNNFSGGHKDPIAIRNYLKFLYDRGACGGGGEP
ncbi:MAG: C25 family cysteine peptidase, partial [Candidatus Krumholzibacteria bacterium]|nr:C25 family cysteine peptidase [Candidatus Krumholzibacteria bacterium]